MPSRDEGGSAPARFAVGDRVRLRQEFQGMPAGSVGTVIGFYQKDSVSYAVFFGGPAREVPADLLEQAAEPAA